MSRYRLLEELGRGGMGVVYRAEDTRLGRQVALKFLSDDLVNDPVAMARFHLEAHAASALNHPNICTVHDIGAHAGRSFIAMELLEGETLHERMARGPLHLDQILDLGIEIAEALGAAHAKGVLHRDLKPSNIFLTALGHPKVMDFGLAKIGKAELGLTAAGFAPGTASYMSPEQARGEELDARTDLFSLGAVLYELATGHRAFSGATQAVILEAVLNREPTPAIQLNPSIPPGLQALIEKALRKRREDRFRSAVDIADGLRKLKRLRATVPVGAPTDTTVALEPASRPERWRRPITVAILGIAVVAGLFLTRFGQRPVAPPPPKWTQLTSTGNADEATLSPDGKMIAYALIEQSGRSRLMVQDVEGGNAVEIGQATRIESGSLRWTAEGNSVLATILVDSTWMTSLLPRMGGPQQPISTVYGRDLTLEEAEALPIIGALSPDGATLAGAAPPSKSITLRGLSGADSVSIPLKAKFEWLQAVDWSPDGQRLVYSVQEGAKSSLWTMRRDGTRQQKVYEDSAALWCPRWSPGGKAIYCIRAVSRRGSLLKVPLSANGGPSRSRPRVLLTEPNLEGPIAISRDGRRLVCVRALNYGNVWLWDRARQSGRREAAPRQVTKGTAWIGDIKLSPDGTQLAYVKDESGTQDVHVLSLKDGVDRQLAFLGRDAKSVAWSPDGKSIAFTAADGDTLRVWRVPSGGGKAVAFKLSSASGSFGEIAWAPGREIIYQADENRTFRALDPATGAERPLLPEGFQGWVFAPVWSSDQRRFAFTRYAPPLALWVGSALDRSARELLSYPLMPWRWDPHDAGVLAWGLRGLVRVSYPDGDSSFVLDLPRAVQQPDRNSRYPMDFTADLGTVVYKVSERKSDAWLVEGFDPDVK